MSPKEKDIDGEEEVPGTPEAANEPEAAAPEPEAAAPEPEAAPVTAEEPAPEADVPVAKPSAKAKADASSDDDEDDDDEEGDEPEVDPAQEAAQERSRRLRRRRKAAGAPDPAPVAAPTRRRSRRDPSLPAPVVRAQAKYVRSSARKARLVCDNIRGKSVDEARAILAHTPRAIARDWSKLLESAVANAEHNHELIGEDLYVKAVTADEGPTIKRFQPRAMGRATKIRKRTSHLTILLTPKD
jgi:ribosomal protein L22